MGIKQHVTANITVTEKTLIILQKIIHPDIPKG
jgi:hypothetical protein